MPNDTMSDVIAQLEDLKEFLHIVTDDDLDNPWWQVDDIEFITSRPNGVSANFSEMGCFKTSTALRSIKWFTRNMEFPTVLIVTTRSGKGTMFKHAHQILPDWTVLNVDTQGISVVMPDGEEKRVGGGLKFIPEEFEMPVLVVTHYHLFSRSNFGQFQTVKVDDPTSPNGKKEIYIKDKNGNFIKKPWTQADHVVNRKWHFIWLDEAHRVKDKDAKWTVVLKRANLTEDPPGGKHVSTGTGFINRPDEIWSPLNFLDRERYSSYWDFFEEFCEVDAWDGYAKVSGLKKDKIEEFRALVRAIGPRRTLDEVMPHIVQPIYTEFEVELNPIQRRMYDSIKGELYALDQKGVTLHASNVLSLLQRLRAICVATPEVVADYYDPKEDRRVQKIKLVEPSSKLDRVMELLDELPWEVGARTGDEHKAHVVIFSNFVGPLQLLEARFNKANEASVEMGFEPEYPFIWMRAEHSDEERFNMWNKLFASGEYRVFMSTLQLGGESISLTGARHVIFLDRSWSPAANAQGVGRIRRPGQTGQPQVVNINATNTTDKYVKDVVNLKEGWFQDIFGDWKP